MRLGDAMATFGSMLLRSSTDIMKCIICGVLGACFIPIAISPAMPYIVLTLLISLSVALCIGLWKQINGPKINPPRRYVQNQMNALKTSLENDMIARDERVEQNTAEISRLRARLDQALLEINGLKQDNRQLRTEIGSLRRKIGELVELGSQLLKDNEELRLQNQDILKQNTDMLTENRQMQLENRQMLVDNNQTNETNNQILIQLMHMQQDGAADAPQ